MNFDIESKAGKKKIISFFFFFFLGGGERGGGGQVAGGGGRVINTRAMRVVILVRGILSRPVCHNCKVL